MPLIKCVPNFSEGRDATKIASIVGVVRGVPGAVILDLHSDASHNRSVLTFIGAPEAVREAAIRVAGEAARLIDMNAHRGEHPRVGAADVVPFVPVSGLVLQDCVAIAHAAGEEIYRRFGVPVYFYEAAARRLERRPLEYIRRIQYEGLRLAVLTNPDLGPDIGGPELHPTAGATMVGARKILIAFNVNLNSSDVAIARIIARNIRSAGHLCLPTGEPVPPVLPALKALGMLIHPSGARTGGEGRAQVAMNLVDYERTSMWDAYRAVEREAARLAVSIHSSELVGLAPQDAFGGASPEQLKLANFSPEMILENRL